MRAIRTSGKYNLYRIDGHLELWRGKFGEENSYRAGYVSDKENFLMACDVADDEMAWMMAEGM